MVRFEMTVDTAGWGFYYCYFRFSGPFSGVKYLELKRLYIVVPAGQSGW